MELEALSRNDHLEDFRQNRVHVVCRFRARKTYASAHGVGEISARHVARTRCWAHPSETALNPPLNDGLRSVDSRARRTASPGGDADFDGGVRAEIASGARVTFREPVQQGRAVRGERPAPRNGAASIQGKLGKSATVS